MRNRAKPAHSSEVGAYIYIKENLKQLGWDTRNPERHSSGQVYTQAECLANEEIKACLNLDKPENIVKVTDTVLWVIEAKREHRELSKALKEAEEYAVKINASKNLRALFISGVAGNETDSYLVETRFLVNGNFVPITMNEKKVSSLLSSQAAHMIMGNGPCIEDVVIDEALFLSKAEKINQHLHLGAINKNQRARVMAALLLAMIDETPPNIDASPNVLISDINARALSLLEYEHKPKFYPYIQITLPTTPDNHIKFKKALVQTIQELNNLNIRSAMNSGADVLGKFYEVFLKYGNGAKEIGIVLTPRHITKFAVEVLGISDKDVVYDPTCGTAGFLVAAFDDVKKNFKEDAVNSFKRRNLFGIEQEAEVVALAIVNMIFRGDGKNNIDDGDCFQKNLVETNGKIEWSKEKPKPSELAVTKVLMNPPFALKSSDEKEYKFVEHALDQMRDGNLLFAVLPYSAMVKPGRYYEWRKDRLLPKHTLLAVVTFPPDLFCPIGVHTVGVFVKKGIPHPNRQAVLWARALNDGLLKSKGKRLPNDRAANDYIALRSILKAFLNDPASRVDNRERFLKACPIDFSDPLLELVPENYLDQSPPNEEEIRDGIEQIVRDSVAYLVRSRQAHE